MESAPISGLTILLSAVVAIITTLITMKVRRSLSRHRPRPQSVGSLPDYSSAGISSRSLTHAHAGPELRGELARDHPVWQELERLGRRVSNLETARNENLEDPPLFSYEHSASAQYVPQLVASSVDSSHAHEPTVGPVSPGFFAEIPDSHGRFLTESVTPERRSKSLYEIRPGPDQRSAIVTICQNADIQRAIQNHEDFLLPVCEYGDQFPQLSRHTRIDVTEPGRAIRDDKGWLVNGKIHVRFS